jgi:cytochrome oxidase Cu insertion factor (SCO1/SenC/PrrC family)
LSLEKTLESIRASSAKKMPEGIRTTLQKATEELRTSGILKKAMKAGQLLPNFTLQNQDNEPVSSASILEKGSLILTIFRGHW